jgi:heat shock protein HslJ
MTVPTARFHRNALPIRRMPLTVALLMLALPSCHKSGPPPAAPVVRSGPAPTLEQLRNATYQGVAEESTLTLTSGRWEGLPFVPGGAERPSANLVGEFRLVGDVDRDGGEDALVLLAGRSGGTAENIYLALVQNRGGSVVNTATALIGDRVQVRGGSVRNGRVALDVLQAASVDALCCPGELATRVWTYAAGGLQEAAEPESMGRLSLQAMEGPEWVLRFWTEAQPAPLEPRVTLRVAEGILNGRAACNGYSARPRTGDKPGELSVGPVASTRMACADSIMKIESRYLNLLGRVRQFGFSAGRLALSYEKDSVNAVMLFERAAPPDTSRPALPPGGAPKK